MKGGIKFDFRHNKLLTENKIRSFEKVNYVNIFLCEGGNIAKAKVKSGDLVKAGQVIAQREDGFPIFASISGKVSCVSEEYIKIENDLKFAKKTMRKIKQTPESVKKRIKDAGIVCGGGQALYTKLSGVKNLVINICESEDYLDCESTIAINKTSQVLKGAIMLSKAIGLNGFYVAIERGSNEALPALKKEINELDYDIKLDILPNVYPIGNEKIVAGEVLGKKIDFTKSLAEQEILVIDAMTALAIYEAVKLGKPFYERVVTISGRAIKKPANVMMKNGTSFESALTYVGGEVFDKNRVTEFEKLKEDRMALLEEYALACLSVESRTKNKENPNLKEDIHRFKELKKQYNFKAKKFGKELSLKAKEIRADFKNSLVKLVKGGPMVGEAVESLSATITLSSKGMLFLSKEECYLDYPTACIKCGKCIDVCPVKINPVKLEYLGELGRINDCKINGANRCIECGACSFICPARRDLKASVQLVKTMIKEAENE